MTRDWQRHFFYRTESLKTTWKFRVLVAAAVILPGVLARGWCALWIARSLVCAPEIAPSDAILLDNFNPSYPVFQRAAELQSNAVGGRILVPVSVLGDSDVFNPFSKALAELMVQYSRLRDWEMLRVTQHEPISLNAAAQIRDYVAAHGIRSVTVVSPGFRSRRSWLTYRTVFNDIQVQVHCVPVFTTRNPVRWTNTWHGVQEVGEQYVKLQYYRFYVLPFLAPGVLSSKASPTEPRSAAHAASRATEHEEAR